MNLFFFAYKFQLFARKVRFFATPPSLFRHTLCSLRSEHLSDLGRRQDQFKISGACWFTRTATDGTMIPPEETYAIVTDRNTNVTDIDAV